MCWNFAQAGGELVDVWKGLEIGRNTSLKRTSSNLEYANVLMCWTTLSNFLSEILVKGTTMWEA